MESEIMSFNKSLVVCVSLVLCCHVNISLTRQYYWLFIASSAYFTVWQLKKNKKKQSKLTFVIPLIQTWDTKDSSRVGSTGFCTGSSWYSSDTALTQTCRAVNCTDKKKVAKLEGGTCNVLSRPLFVENIFCCSTVSCLHTVKLILKNKLVIIILAITLAVVHGSICHETNRIQVRAQTTSHRRVIITIKPNECQGGARLLGASPHFGLIVLVGPLIPHSNISPISVNHFQVYLHWRFLQQRRKHTF